MSRPGVLVKHLALRGPHVSTRRGCTQGPVSPATGAPSRGDPPRGGASTDLTKAVPVGDVLAPPLSHCEIDPEMYRIFAHAVLSWHRRLPKLGGDRCACGKPWLDCEYVDLADKLLWTGAADWRTL